MVGLLDAQDYAAAVARYGADFGVDETVALSVLGQLEDLLEMLRAGNKLDAIQAYIRASGTSVADAQAFLDRLASLAGK
jgi:hypothetical protein